MQWVTRWLTLVPNKMLGKSTKSWDIRTNSLQLFYFPTKTNRLSTSGTFDCWVYFSLGKTFFLIQLKTGSCSGPRTNELVGDVSPREITPVNWQRKQHILWITHLQIQFFILLCFLGGLMWRENSWELLHDAASLALCLQSPPHSKHLVFSSLLEVTLDLHHVWILRWKRSRRDSVVSVQILVHVLSYLDDWLEQIVKNFGKLELTNIFFKALNSTVHSIWTKWLPLKNSLSHPVPPCGWQPKSPPPLCQPRSKLARRRLVPPHRLCKHRAQCQHRPPPLLPTYVALTWGGSSAWAPRSKKKEKLNPRTASEHGWMNRIFWGYLDGHNRLWCKNISGPRALSAFDSPILSSRNPNHRPHLTSPSPEWAPQRDAPIHLHNLFNMLLEKNIPMEVPAE